MGKVSDIGPDESSLVRMCIGRNFRNRTRPFAVLAIVALFAAGCSSDGGAGDSPADAATSSAEPSPEPDGYGSGPGGDGAGPGGSDEDDASSAPVRPQGELVAAAPHDLEIGMAVAGGGHHLDTDLGAGAALEDGSYAGILAANFTSLTPENQLKWEWLRPTRDEYDFAAADEIVEFAAEHDQVVRGHALLWHSQNPAWLEEGDFTDDELREILRDHITTVVGRYAGRIAQWDVANEIIGDDAQLRTEENVFLRRLGPEIVADAFRWAHEADPGALLFLNDYSIESPGPKSDAYYELAQELLADDVPLHGMGFQGHLSMAYGKPGGMTENLARFADLGLEVAVTEADVRMKTDDGVPSSADLEAQGQYFVTMLDACLAVETCRSFTVWGMGDALSWVPFTFPGEGAATLLDEDLATKPAFWAVVERLEAGR